MSPVDNFDLIAQFIPEEFDGDTFFYSELLDRTKRSGNNKGRIVKTFFYRTREDLYRTKEQLVALCNLTGARAYIRLGPRSFKKVGMKYVLHVVEQSLTENWQGMRHGYNHACGTTGPNKKYWIFDCDQSWDELKYDPRIVAVMSRPEYVCTIPSKKGFHLITTGFDIRQVPEMKDINIHKDNPTNLYIPSDDKKMWYEPQVEWQHDGYNIKKIIDSTKETK